MSNRDLDDHYARNGQDTSSARNFGTWQAGQGQQSSGQLHNETHSQWWARDDAHRRETERLAEERKRNGY